MIAHSGWTAITNTFYEIYSINGQRKITVISAFSGRSDNGYVDGDSSEDNASSPTSVAT